MGEHNSPPENPDLCLLLRQSYKHFLFLNLKMFSLYVHPTMGGKSQDKNGVIISGK